jgi:hypothetical protein
MSSPDWASATPVAYRDHRKTITTACLSEDPSLRSRVPGRSRQAFRHLLRPHLDGFNWEVTSVHTPDVAEHEAQFWDCVPNNSWLVHSTKHRLTSLGRTVTTCPQ